MPGVLLVEAMAQVSAFFLYPTLSEDRKNGQAEGMSCRLVSVDRVRFRVPVVPGDRLSIRVKCVRCGEKIWAFEGLIEVEGKEVASANFMAAFSREE
jgi:3-hydroxyacyl-[acyl-carrier-protein] dehydratase